MSFQVQRHELDDNMALGYSASVCDYSGDDETSNSHKPNRSSNFQSNFKYTDSAMTSSSNFYCHSTSSATPSLFSKSSANTTAPNKEIILDSWYVQPMVGTLTIQVCGKRIDSGKQWKTGAIAIRVNSRCILTSNNSLYRLVGPIFPAKNIPRWFEEMFSCGFPKSWKADVAEYMKWLSKEESGGESDVEEPAKKHKFINAKPVEQPPVKLELHQWAIKIFGNYIFVEGFALNCSGTLQLYQTGSIQKVLKKTLLSTINGGCYRIKGPISLEATVQGGVPLWFARKFNVGFPSNWKELLSNYLNYISSKDGGFQEIPSHCEESSLFSDYISNKRSGNTIPSNQFSFLTNRRHNSDTSCLSTVVNIPNTLVKPTRKKKKKCDEVFKDRSFTVLSSASKANFEQDNDKTITDDDFDIIPSKEPKESAPTKRQRNLHPSKKRRISNVKHAVNKKNSTTRSRSVSKLKTTEASSVSTPSFCSPNVERGLYRTRSGRHVFPPLQNWTYQRLVTEKDENGNDVVVFIPGKKSVLNIVSPAAEYLRTADWIHRQFEQDQLLSVPSPSLTSGQKISIKRKKSVKRNCVKNLLNVTPVIDSINGDQPYPHNLSVSTHEGSMNDSNNESFQTPSFSTVLDPLMNSPRFTQPPHKIVQQSDDCETRTSSDPQVVSAKSNNACFIRSTRETPKKVGDGRALTKTTLPHGKNIETGEHKSPENKTVTTTKCSDIVTTNTAPPTVHINEKTKSLFASQTQVAEKKKTRKGTRQHLLCPEKDPPRGRYNLRSRDASPHLSSSQIPLQPETSNVDRETRSCSALVEKSLKRKRTGTGKVKKVSAIRTTNFSENAATKDVGTSVTDSVASNALLPKVALKRLVEVEPLVANPIPAINVKSTKTEKRKPPVKRMSKSAGRNKKTAKKQVLSNSSHKFNGQTRTDSEAKDKSLIPLTAGRGTVKLKKQIKATLAVLNQAKNDQDFFEAENSNSDNKQPSFSDELFQLDSKKNFITPYTPVSKLPTGFEEYVATPSWFKTPNGAEGFSCTDFNTPKAAKSSSSLEPSRSTAEQACRAVVQIQNEQKKKRKPVLKAEKVKPPKKKRTVPPPDMFHVEVEQDQCSDKEDDYFSE